MQHQVPKQPERGRGRSTLNRELLMVSISRFYADKTNMQAVLPIVSGESKISLRLIDWFVTNYAKRHNVTILSKAPGASHFNVYASYRAQLKAYSKQQFDPFRRRDRIDFYYDKNLALETTIGQLNFFRWMLQNDLLGFLEAHYEEIESEMLHAAHASDSAKSASSAEGAADGASDGASDRGAGTLSGVVSDDDAAWFGPSSPAKSPVAIGGCRRESETEAFADRLIYRSLAARPMTISFD